MLSSRAKNGTDSSTFVEHVNENKNKISKTMDAGSKYSYSSDKRKTYHRFALLHIYGTGWVLGLVGSDSRQVTDGLDRAKANAPHKHR